MKKLDVGPGDNPLGEDWDILDVVGNPTIKADLNNKLPIEDNTYDIIYASHVLEHIVWHNVSNVLQELYRILKPGGTLEIWVPDMDKIIMVYLNPNVMNFDSIKLPESYKENPMVWCCYRIYGYLGKNKGVENLHKGCFNSFHLSRCLEQAGFKNIKFIDKPRGYDHGFINLGMSGEK